MRATPILNPRLFGGQYEQKQIDTFVTPLINSSNRFAIIRKQKLFYITTKRVSNNNWIKKTGMCEFKIYQKLILLNISNKLLIS